MKIDLIRGKTDTELDFDLAELKKELFDMRFRSATELLPNPARISQMRREIAQINTVLHERQAGIRGQESR